MTTRTMSQISLMNYFDVVKPKLTEKENWIYEAIEELAPCTAAIVAEHYGVPEHTISGRFSGLRKKGKIVIAYKGKNSRGATVAYWRPKDAESEYNDGD